MNYIHTHVRTLHQKSEIAFWRENECARVTVKRRENICEGPKRRVLFVHMFCLFSAASQFTVKSIRVHIDILYRVYFVIFFSFVFSYVYVCCVSLCLYKLCNVFFVFCTTLLHILLHT